MSVAPSRTVVLVGVPPHVPEASLRGVLEDYGRVGLRQLGSDWHAVFPSIEYAQVFLEASQGDFSLGGEQVSLHYLEEGGPYEVDGEAYEARRSDWGTGRPHGDFSR
eukprot:scaffold232227_cov31-Tisochrysis_lutea.AAC.1